MVVTREWVLVKNGNITRLLNFGIAKTGKNSHAVYILRRHNSPKAIQLCSIARSLNDETIASTTGKSVLGSFERSLPTNLT
ncbi:MAG: hypothetical protein ACJAYN_001680 [Bermanella sp.]|jgi:hypothetical protein